MRKVVSIFLLTVYLLSTTQLVELLKVPVLIEHYNEHKKDNPSITLLGFLDLHYMHGCPRDNDYARDMQLPFKMHTHSVLASIIYNMPCSYPAVTSAVHFRKLIQTYTKGQTAYTFDYLAAIWQPPRTV